MDLFNKVKQGVVDVSASPVFDRVKAVAASSTGGGGGGRNNGTDGGIAAFQTSTQQGFGAEKGPSSSGGGAYSEAQTLKIASLEEVCKTLQDELTTEKESHANFRSRAAQWKEKVRLVTEEDRQKNSLP